MSVDAREVTGAGDFNVSSGEAPLLDWIAGLGSGNDQVDLPALPLNYRVEYSGAELASVVIHESAQPAGLIQSRSCPGWSGR